MRWHVNAKPTHNPFGKNNKEHKNNKDHSNTTIIVLVIIIIVIIIDGVLKEIPMQRTHTLGPLFAEMAEVHCPLNESAMWTNAFL